MTTLTTEEFKTRMQGFIKEYAAIVASKRTLLAAAPAPAPKAEAAPTPVGTSNISDAELAQLHKECTQYFAAYTKRYTDKSATPKDILGLSTVGQKCQRFIQGYQNAQATTQQQFATAYSDIKRIYQDIPTLEANIKNLVETGHWQPNPQEVAEANQEAQAFLNDNSRSKSPFAHISKQDFVNSLLNRISDASGVNQQGTPLCGPAAFLYIALKRDPKGLTKAAIELYETGKTVYNKLPIKANKAMLSLKSLQDPNGYNMDVLDWLILPAIKDNGYDPSEYSGLKGITTPGKLLSWLDTLPNSRVEKFMRDPSVEQFNKWYNTGAQVAFLIDVVAMDDFFVGGHGKDATTGGKGRESDFLGSIFGSHYVVLTSHIEENNGLLEFTIFTWGIDNQLLQIPADKFNKTIKRTLVIENEQ